MEKNNILFYIFIAISHFLVMIQGTTVKVKIKVKQYIWSSLSLLTLKIFSYAP
jgi:hypothetical protein